MVYGCPICSERLDRLPGAQSGQNKNEEIHISSTPCGHIFHTFCIQKWLTGSIATSKQCPCCRKPVPGLKTLPLYPDRYDVSLDDSTLQDNNSPSLCDHSHFINQLSSLKKVTEGLRDKITEAEELLEIQKDISKDHRIKYDREKERSETYLFQWKQAESYKSYGEQQERMCTDVTEKLKQYEIIDALVKNVKQDVKYELERYTSSCNTNSLEKLLEIHHVIKDEYDSATKKLGEAQVKQENDRHEIARLRKKYNDLQKAYRELEGVHSNCSNYSFVTGTTPKSSNKIDLKVMDNNSGTPLVQIKPSKSNLGKHSVDLDSDILMQPFNKTRKLLSKRGLDKPQTETQAHSSNSQSQDEGKEHSPKKLKTGSSSQSSQISKSKKHFPSSFEMKQQQPSSLINSNALKGNKSQNDHNQTIDLDDSSDDDLPLRGNLPGVKIETRHAQPKAARQFTFKKKF